jgi:ornithine cyclodeaminase/alanine dehydrogenase-like protein (mu-crystallin family)
MTIVITDDDVKRLLSMEECIDAMRTAFADLADGKAASLPRMRYAIDTADPSKRYLANIQAGAVPSFGVACVRAGSRFMQFEEVDGIRRVLHNVGAKNWTIIILYDLATAEPLAFIHETHIGEIRVGATTGVAVDKCARVDASTLGLFGSGNQAGPILEAICAVRDIKRVAVYSPTEANRSAFADRYNRPGLEVIAVTTPRDAVDGADIVCCATNAAAPVFDGAWLTPGQTVVSIVNSDVTGRRTETDETVFARSARIVINDWDSVHANEQVELLEALEDGRLKKSDVHLLGDVITGRAPARKNDEEIVYYKNNTGLGMQFAAAGAIVWQKMKNEKTPYVIPTEWLGSDTGNP